MMQTVEASMQNSFRVIQEKLTTYIDQNNVDFEPSDIKNTTFPIMLGQVRSYVIISHSLSIKHEGTTQQDYDNVETRVRFDLFITLYSQFENAIKIIIRSLPKAKKVYKFVEENVSDELYRGFNLAKELRNCIHNNGFYFPNNGHSNTIHFNDKKFELLYGEGIDFLTWELVTALIINLINVLDVIFKMPSLQKIENPITMYTN